MPGGRGGVEAAGTSLAAAWRRWRDRRPSTQLLHLDSAAAGRSSAATLEASATVAARAAAVGASAAAAEVESTLEAGRAALAGLLGVNPGGVAFVGSATAALESLLSAWPLQPGDAVGVVPSEWGRNLAAFERHGLQLVVLAVHDDGSIDLKGLEAALTSDPPAFVHLTQVASHRSLVQPVGAAAVLCNAAGIPLWVDAAQAIGHVDTACGADVQYATSRKWLTGPHDVGLLAVADRWWDVLRIRSPPQGLNDELEGVSPIRLLEPRDVAISGRVGLCVAVREYQEAGPEKVWQRLGEVGSLTRELLTGLPGWAVLEANGVPSAITAVRATRGQDVRETRARLLTAHRIITTAEEQDRAPREMTEPLLRISPHVDCTVEDLRLLREALISAA
jgi:hercynylcysteine S-oxide lyase